MDRKEDIKFLDHFRSLVVESLTRSNGDRSPEREQTIKKQLTEMKPRVEQLFREFGFERRSLTEYPPPFLAGSAPVIDYPLLSLLTSDALRESYYSPAEETTARVLDLGLITIDECIGHLKMSETQAKPASQDRGQEKRTAGTGQGLVFIAMPMTSKDARLEDIHEAIKSAAQDAGLKAERIDDQISNEKITERIVEAIRDADFVVVDLTDGRPNVYWEAGYAHGLGKTPIYVALEDTELEFDVRDYPVIFYVNATRLRRELARRLRGLKSQREQQ